MSDRLKRKHVENLEEGDPVRVVADLRYTDHDPNVYVSVQDRDGEDFRIAWSAIVSVEKLPNPPTVAELQADIEELRSELEAANKSADHYKRMVGLLQQKKHDRCPCQTHTDAPILSPLMDPYKSNPPVVS